MRKNININNKILKYSIRKLSFGVAPIVVGMVMFGSYAPMQETFAADVKFQYIEKNELNENEKKLIKESIPKEYKNEDTYYLVYEKIVKDKAKAEILPNTGSSNLPIAGLGIGTAVLAVLLISKKHRNKVLSAVLIGAMGQSVVIPYETFALESKALIQFNKQTDVVSNIDLERQVIDIPGYKYMGYFTSEDLKLEVSEKKEIENKVQEKNTVENNQNQALGAKQQTQQQKSVLENEKAQSTQPVVQPGQEPKETVNPKKQIETTQPVKTVDKPTQTQPVKAEQSRTKPVQPTVKPTSVQPTQPTNVGKTVQTQSAKVEKPVVSTGGEEVKALVNEVPEYTLPIEAKGTQEVGHEGEALVQPALPEYTGPVASSGGEEVKDLVHEVPEYTLPLEAKGTQIEGNEGEALVQPELPEYRGPVASSGGEEVKDLVHEVPEYTLPIETKGTQEVSYEGEALVQPALSEYSDPVATKGTQIEGNEGEALVQPALPEYTGPAATTGGEEVKELVHEVPEYTLPLEAKGTQEVGREGEALVQPTLPEYTGPVATTGGEEVKNLVHEVPEYTLPLEIKGTQEEGHEGEALVQPALPEYTGTVATKGTQEAGREGETLVQPTLPEYTEALTTKGTQEVGHEGEALVQSDLLEFTGSAKLEPAVEERPALDVVTKHRTAKETLPYEVEEISDPMLLKNRRRIEQQGRDGLRTIEYEDYLVNGKVEATKELSRTQIDPIKQIVKLGTLVKRKPTIEIANLTKDESKKSITVSYNLTDPTWAYVSAKAQIFDGDKLVKEVDIENTNKEQVIKGLDYYTPYTLKTKLTYNLGDFDEYSTETSIKNFNLDYKKLEIKDIDSVELYGKENGRYRRYLSLSEVPKDTTNYFAKVKSDRFKEMYLPVQSITENADGNYKVTAAINQLVEEGLEGYKDHYSFNVAKTKAEQNGVYTSFKNLVAAMQGNMSGVFKLGSDMTADEVGLLNNGTSYLTGTFTGKLIGSDGTKSYAIYDLKKPLFETLRGAMIKDLDLKNVDVDSRENAAALAKTANKATISNVSVEGKVAGRKSVAGLVVSAANTVIENSSFTGTIVANHANTTASYAGGIVGNLSGSESVIDRAKVDAQISTAARNASQNTGGIAGKVDGGALINNSVTSGKIINGHNYSRIGGIVGSTWKDGRINNVVSNMNVGYGYAITGDQYDGADIVNAMTAVNNKKDDKYATKLTKEQAKERIATYGITTTLEDTGEFLKTNVRTVDYTKLSKAQADRKVAYNNIEKLMPFYNKELVVNYGNKVDKTDKLYTTELLDVVPMNGNNIVTDIYNNKNTINRLMLHYKDNTVAYLDVTFKGTFENNQVLEYNVTGKEYIFTPETFVSDYTKIANKVLGDLRGVVYNSESMKKVLGVTDNEAIDNLYLDKEFEKVKGNIGEHLRKVLVMDKSINTVGEGVVEYISEKIRKNKEAFLLGLTYMSRWYNINYDNMNTKDLTMYKFDFNGNNEASTLDTIIAIGNSEIENLRGGNNVGLYSSLLAPLKGEDTVFDFVEAYRKLFLPNKTNNQWFKDNTKAYIVETKSDIPEVRKKQEEAAADSKYSLGVYDRISSPTWKYRGMLLPLLTLPEESVYAISNMSTLSFGGYERYRDTVDGSVLSGDALRQYVHGKVDQAAKWERDHYDIWYNLLSPEYKERLFRSVPIVDGFAMKDTQGRSYWATATDKNIDSIYNFFGPAGKWYGNSPAAGAYATGYEVHYVSDRLLDKYGTSVYTHEMTHNSDGHIYFEGNGRREGLGAELYALGLLQSADSLEKDAIVLNTLYKGDKDSLTRLHAYNPTERYKSAADLQQYVHGMYDVLYTLDAMEAKAVVSKSNDVKKKWYRKIENFYVKDSKYKKDTHAGNSVRPLTNEEVAKLISLESLIDNNIINRRAYRDNSQYVRNGYHVISMFSPIYAGLSNSKGAPGDIMFRKTAYELLAEKGYQNGFIPYVSNKYAEEAKQKGSVAYSDWLRKDVGLVTDDLVLSKVFNNQYKSWADFKKAMFNERIANQDRLKPITIQYELGDAKSTKEVTITSAAQMQQLIDAAVAKDITNIDRATSYVSPSWVHLLKQKIYNAYLRSTDDFRQSIYK